MSSLSGKFQALEFIKLGKLVLENLERDLQNNDPDNPEIKAVTIPVAIKILRFVADSVEESYR